MLYDRGVHIVPDFIANAGGIIAAYVELLLDDSNEAAKAGIDEIAYAKLRTRETITANVREVMNLTIRERCNPEQACLHIAPTRALN